MGCVILITLRSAKAASSAGMSSRKEIIEPYSLWLGVPGILEEDRRPRNAEVDHEYGKNYFDYTQIYERIFGLSKVEHG